MINVEALTVENIIKAYESAGFENIENYTSISIRQLKFRRGHIYIDFNWKSDIWEYPLKDGFIDVFIIGEASYTSKARWAQMERYELPKELLYEATITIESEEKLIIYLNNALTERALEALE